MRINPRPGRIAGIDVSLKELVVAWKDPGGGVQQCTVQNNPTGHARLGVLFGGRRRPSRIVVEATGSFHVDLCMALGVKPGIEVMVVNPYAARRFAEAQLRRAKTDRVDARSLLDFCERMPFTAWTPPREILLEYRDLVRHLSRLVADRTAVLNQVAANRATTTSSSFVANDLAAATAALDERIAACEKAALALKDSDPELKARHDALDSVPGIADRSALLIGGEFALLEATMSPDEVVAHAGLDPRPRQSGARDAPRRLSKVGNARLRGAMYMPALAASQHNKAVRAWSSNLAARGKPTFVVLAAVARRLLRVAWVVYRAKGEWDEAKFLPKGATPKPVGEASPTN